MNDGRLTVIMALLGIVGAKAALSGGSRAEVRGGRGPKKPELYANATIADALIEELRESYNAAGAMELT
jgi:hypothetical protein